MARKHTTDQVYDHPEDMEGIPHTPGTSTIVVPVLHPGSGDTYEIHVPADHDGSRIQVEFPDGRTTFIEGFDPAQQALSAARPTVPCPNCGVPQTVTGEAGVCGACGAAYDLQLRASGDSGAGASTEG